MKLKPVRAFAFFLLLALISWVLVHFLTVFGAFIAIAYPLLWLLFSKRIPCLLCRAKSEGDICPFCRRSIVKKGNLSPKTFYAAVLNSILIMGFSLISIGLVYLEGQLLNQMGFSNAKKTVSFSIPSTGQYRLGEVFPVKLEINGIETSINAVQVDLAFDPQRLEVLKVSTTNSFASVFIQKEINNQLGYMRLTGGLPNPGYAQKTGLFGTVYFRSKVSGVTTVKFMPSSMVLANDGKGSNVLKEFRTFSYLILPQAVTAEERDLQKSVMSTVLGESTSSAQLHLYEEKNVLGTQSDISAPEARQSFFSTILSAIVQFDSFILSQWKNLLFVL